MGGYYTIFIVSKAPETNFLERKIKKHHLFTNVAAMFKEQ